MNLILQIIGFYLVIIGTWRLATSTVDSRGKVFFGSVETEEKYNPLLDLLAIKEVIKWLISTVKSFNKPSQLSGASILHKQFNWGLFWLFLGLTFQSFSQFIK